MKALILAAGYATRMYPLTLDYPKPLLSVGGKKILDWLREDIHSSGIDDIYVVTNHRFYEKFLSWKGGKDDITLLDDKSESNETRLGALRDIAFVLEKERLDDDLLVLAGDNVLDFSLRSFILYAERKKTSCVMRHYENDKKKLMRTGVCTVDENDRITSMEEKPSSPKSSWAVPPFYFFKREDLPFISKALDEKVVSDAPGSFIVYLSSHSAVHAFLMPGMRYDIGTIEGYEKLKGEYRGIVRG